MNNASASKKRKAADEHPESPAPKRRNTKKKNRSQFTVGKENGESRAKKAIQSNKAAQSPQDLLKNFNESKDNNRGYDYWRCYIEAYMNYYKKHGPKLISAELIDTFENYLKNFKQTSIPKKSDNENAAKLAEEIRINLKNNNATELDIYLNLKNCIDKKQFSYDTKSRSLRRDTGKHKAESDSKKGENLNETIFNNIISSLESLKNKSAIYLFYYIDGYITYYSRHKKTMIDKEFQDRLASGKIPDWQVILVDQLVEGELSTDSLQNEEKVSTPDQSIGKETERPAYNSEDEAEITQDQIIGKEDTMPTDDSEGENGVTFSLNSFGIFTTKQLETTRTTPVENTLPEPELEGLRGYF